MVHDISGGLNPPPPPVEMSPKKKHSGKRGFNPIFYIPHQFLGSFYSVSLFLGFSHRCKSYIRNSIYLSDNSNATRSCSIKINQSNK